jgi:tetratricopeptide (TPR) repeat protein
MGYTVAWDDGRKTNAAYMEAAAQNGIPCSFLVDGKGKIAFIGHPIELDSPLAAVVAGNWDAARKQMGEVSDAFLRDAEKGKAALDAFATKYPEVLPMLEQQLYRKSMQAGRHEQAGLVAARLVDRAIAAKDDETLNEIAWNIVDPAAKIEKRDLDLAMKAAAKGVEFSNEKNANVIDTLARVWFWKHDYQKALELQKKAAAVDPKSEDIKKSLAEYEALVKKGEGTEVKKTDK